MAVDDVPGAPVEAFAADPQVGQDLAAVDWAATPLGEVEGWPQSLRTAVDILLASRFSMWMAWGPDLTFFCNAACRSDMLGQKYPRALGRPAGDVWREIWPEIGPRIGRVLATGESTWDRELLLFLERSGYTEESYHTFSYSPLRDDDGEVVGMLCVVTEETDRVIGERRMATLRELGLDPRGARTDRELLEFAAGRFERNQRDLPFTLSYLFGDDGSAHLAAASGMPPVTGWRRICCRPRRRACGRSGRRSGANQRSSGWPTRTKRRPGTGRTRRELRGLWKPSGPLRRRPVGKARRSGSSSPTTTPT
jgi:hypothetical protein